MTSTLDQGRRLEQRIAAFFGTHGYQTRCNEIREGRSGGRHEIDVLAEKSDPLTTYRVAVECKAWQSPIEKDVVSKLHYVLTDLGLNKGIVVSLAGCRSGAEQAAASLGIELWGPDELRRHLGDAAVGELSVRPTPSRTLTWGWAATVPLSHAETALRSSGKGRFGLRTVEQLVWTSQIWLPVYCVRLTVAQPEARLRKVRLHSTSVVNLYEGLGGAFVGTVRSAGWEQVEAPHETKLRPSIPEAKVHASLRKAVEGYRKVSTAAAVERHTANLAGLGIPTPCDSLSVEASGLVYLPYYVGVLDAGGRQRVAAVTGWSGEPAETVSRCLTTNLTLLRSHFTPR